MTRVGESSGRATDANDAGTLALGTSTSAGVSAEGDEIEVALAAVSGRVEVEMW